MMQSTQIKEDSVFVPFYTIRYEREQVMANKRVLTHRRGS